MHSALFWLALLASDLPEPTVLGTGPNEIDAPIARNNACASCHSSDDGLLASDSYRGSMMSLAGRDPLFLAAWEIARGDDPEVAVLCAKCHFPAAFLDGRIRADDVDIREADKDGVACDVCHRFTVPPPVDPDDALSGLPPGNAQFFIAPAGGTKLGAYPTDIAIGHRSEESPLFSDSRLCGTCHDVTDVFVERMTPEGEGLGRAMPVERTFSEWRQSAFAQPGDTYATCQTCHMKKSAVEVAPAVSLSTEIPVRRVSDHRIVGSGTIAPRMVAVLADEGGDPYLDGLAPVLENSAREAERMLREDSARLDVLGVGRAGGDPVLRVRVTNLTGHKLPTGYSEGRRMFLSSVTVLPDGSCGPRTGILDPETCEMQAGEAPVTSWEILLGHPGTGPSFHFATVSSILLDARIPPAGFLPDEDTAPVGHAFELQPDGSLASWDDVSLPLGAGDRWPVDVEVRLLFQATTGDFLRFLVRGAEEHGAELARLWEAAGGGPPVEMAAVRLRVHEDGAVETLTDWDDTCDAVPFADVPAGACLPDPERPPARPGPAACACVSSASARAPASGLLALLVFVALSRRRAPIGGPGSERRPEKPTGARGGARWPRGGGPGLT